MFGQLQRRFNVHGGSVLGSVTIAKKSASTVMAANFIAHRYFLMRKQFFGAETLEGHFDYDDPTDKWVLSSLEFSPQAFSILKAPYELERQERMKEWRRRIH